MTTTQVITVYCMWILQSCKLTEYQTIVEDLFDSDWYTSCRLIGGADIIVIKYSVNDKTSFQELKDCYVPMVKKALNHCSVPVIISAIGARKNEKMPILKGEASHYNADLHNLLCCCQCADVAFYPEDLSTAVEAHKIILCSVSHLFMLLFGVKSPSNTHDASTLQLAQSLFAVETGDPFPSSPRGVPPCVPPVRVVVKDSVFCSCFPDILHFIYSGAFQWERLEEDIKKKLKDPDKTEHVLEKVKCILKTPGKLNTVKDCKSHQIKQLYNTSLRLFFNTPVLADVIFKIQGTTVPAHRAVLVARCEVMAAMFNGNYLEANSILVPVYGVSKDTFLSFLEYLYTDSCCPASILQAMSLLICAEMYQVMRLQHICELYIITQLQSMPSRELASTSLSIVSLLKKAKFHNSDCLSTWLLHFIATNYLIFSRKPEFQELSEPQSAPGLHVVPSQWIAEQDNPLFAWLAMLSHYNRDVLPGFQGTADSCSTCH
ncbi:rho-related BTB domain-containing protein 3-like protein [Turdus rufiventris]|nr:rho-related BTB domain-containing protein 3-like protein [Turdus rufiventris]